jgi:hypothetical protein
MDYSLIPPFFMRMNNIKVNECPKSLMLLDPMEEDHAVIIRHGDDDITIIPLLLRGTMSFIPVRQPTEQEAHDLGLEHIELTFQSPEWDPSLPDLERMEDLLSTHEGRLKVTGDRTSRDFVRKHSWISDVTLKHLHVIGSKMCSQTTATLSSISNTLADEWDLSQSLQGLSKGVNAYLKAWRGALALGCSHTLIQYVQYPHTLVWRLFCRSPMYAMMRQRFIIAQQTWFGKKQM